MEFLLLEEVDSTNSYVGAHADCLRPGTMVIADAQTAGRGQRGNSWESEPGRNLTFTLFWTPSGIRPREQFAISEATALAAVDWLASKGVAAKVKWPNDIYAGERKIAGILIEHSLGSGAIQHSRIGMGVNVNQEVFRSDAPNPVSLRQLTGNETDISQAAAEMGGVLEHRLAEAETPEGRARLHAAFLAAMWRNDGKPHPFSRRSDGLRFPGRIDGVDPEGPVTITDTASGTTAAYLFKEVEFLPEEIEN